MGRVALLPGINRPEGKAETRLQNRDPRNGAATNLRLQPHGLQDKITSFLVFRSYLHKMKKTPSANCSCPEKATQTARHLMVERSLFSKDRPAVLQTLPPPLVLRYHINTVGNTSFLKIIFHTLQEQSKCN
jgi:hypothetical protein